MVETVSDSTTNFADAAISAPDFPPKPNFWLDLYLKSTEERNASLSPSSSSSSSSSIRDYEWGYVYEHSEKKKKKKMYEVASSSVVNSSSDISEALSSISALLSLSSSESFHSSGKEDQVMEELREIDGSTEKSLCFDIHSLSLESDWNNLWSRYCNGLGEQAKETSNGSKQKQKGEVRKPEIGMKFCSQEEAYEFYGNYAKETGFKVRKGKVQRLSNGSIRKQYFFCSRQGFRSKKQSNKITKYKRKETRTGCDAKMQCTVDNGKWVVSLFSEEHNHNLEVQMPITGFRTETSSEAHLNDEARSRECSELDSTHSDAFLFEGRTARLEPEDSKSLSNNFRHEQFGDLSFFYSVKRDDDSLENFFWKDSRSRLDYEHFGDVLVLDTTYLDKLNRIRAIFLGLNHHRQYVLFGGAFLIDESVDSFLWLIETFMEAMGRHQPKTIITDESEAMADAVMVALPDTKHQLGLWFIQKNASKHLSTYYAQPDFKNLFDDCISGCSTEEELESKWNTLLGGFDLAQNSWLNALYRSRERWAHVFNKTTFCAGIELNDNIRSIFQDINSNPKNLSAFMRQYLQAANEQRRKESYEDSRCIESPFVITGCAMEKQAADAYTCAMFKMFQDELLKCFSLPVVEVSENGMMAVFKLVDDGSKERIVEKSTVDFSVACSCRKYESVGILCRHVLRVLNVLNIFDLPSQYILKRWTKHAKDGVLVDVH